jgi:hypothetical protein
LYTVLEKYICARQLCTLNVLEEGKLHEQVHAGPPELPDRCQLPRFGPGGGGSTHLILPTFKYPPPMGVQPSRHVILSSHVSVEEKGAGKR